MRQVLAITPSTDVTGVLIKLSGTPPLWLVTLTIKLSLIKQELPAYVFFARHYDRVGGAKTKWILSPILKFLICLERSCGVCSPN